MTLLPYKARRWVRRQYHRVQKNAQWYHEKLIRMRSHVEKSLYVRGIVSSERLCLPDFLGIGAQKAGTTWLHENLRHHPELYLPDQKEIHYFNSYFYEGLRSYAEKFVPGRGKIKGEINPDYYILPVERVRFVKAIMPDLKLIFIMRDPINRAWSEAVMELVRKPNRDFKSVDESEFYAFFRSEKCMQRSDYLTALSNWLSVFSPEQLFIGFFEDIKNRPQEFMVKVFAHLGVSSDVDWDSFPLNQVILPRYNPDGTVSRGQRVSRYKSSDAFMPDRYREFLSEMYRHDIEELYARFGGPVAVWRC